MKETLLLLPGLLSDQAVWEHQIASLENEVNIIIPVLNKDNTNAMVEAILAYAPTQFFLAGHSMGGWLALEVMKVAPERVKKLALLNTTAVLDSKEKHTNRLRMIEAVQAGKQQQVIQMVAERSVFNKNCFPAVLNMFDRNIVNFISQQTAMLNRESCVEVLKTIHCPTLIIHAENDQVFSLEDSLFLQEHIPKATLNKISACGHMSPMEQPQVVIHLLQAWVYSNRTS